MYWMFSPPRDMLAEELWTLQESESLVVGDGFYARALASALGAFSLSLGYRQRGALGPTVRSKTWEGLNRAFLVVPERMSVAETLWHHQSLWHRVQILSPFGDQHDLAVVFIIPGHAPMAFDLALASGLSLSVSELPSNGHAIWRRSGTLRQLLDLTGRIVLKDLLLINARREKDLRRLALRRLMFAVKRDDHAGVRDAARVVLDVFGQSLYILDCYCRHPHHHSYGNLVRRWLHAGMAPLASKEWLNEGRERLPIWLDAELQLGAKW
jgi:hypothetical protein